MTEGFNLSYAGALKPNHTIFSSYCCAVNCFPFENKVLLYLHSLVDVQIPSSIRGKGQHVKMNHWCSVYRNCRPSLRSKKHQLLLKVFSSKPVSLCLWHIRLWMKGPLSSIQMPDGLKLIVAIETVLRLKGYSLKMFLIIFDISLYNLSLYSRIPYHNVQICVWRDRISVWVTYFFLISFIF